MTIPSDFALTRHRKFFAKYEATIGTFAKPAGTDAAKVLRADLGLDIERKVRMDSRQTRDALELITGLAVAPWSIEAYVLPSGTAGTPPDLHDLFYACMGGYTNTPATSDAYALASGTVLRTLSLVDHYSDRYMRALKGAFVDKMKISSKGGEEPKVTFEGFAMGHIHTGTSTLNGAMGGVATMVVQTADSYNFEAGSVVAVDDSTNAGAGFQITVDSARPSFTLEAVVTESNGANVTPYSPTETTAGNPINGIGGSLTIDGGSAVPILGVDVSLDNKIKPRDDEAFQQFPTGGIPDYREVTGELTVRAHANQILELGKRKAFGARAILITLGTVAGKKCVISIPYAEFKFTQEEFPDGDSGIIKLPFIGKGSSGEDSLAVTFQ